MICQSCKKENRKEARYCKWCGSSIPVDTMIALDKLIGMEPVKQQITDILEMYASIKMRPETKDISLNTNVLIVGEPGTGKKLLGKVLKEVFYANNIIRKPLLKIVNTTDLNLFFRDLEKNIQQLKGGILLIDSGGNLLNADIMVQDYNLLDKLFLEMNLWNNDPILIMTVLPEEFETYIEQDPVIRNRFRHIFKLETYTAEELVGICEKQLNEELGGIQLSSEAFNILRDSFINEKNLLNGHYARKKAREIYSNYLLRGDEKTGIILPGDITNC